MRMPAMRALALLFFAAACGSQPSLSTSRRAIVGGTKDTADPANVMVAMIEAGACSGTVVSPHVVVTAGHCIDPALIGSGTVVQVFLGDDNNDPSQWQNLALWAALKERHLHPSYSKSSANNDLAVLVTKRALTIAPLPFNRSALSPSAVGAAVRLIGFGEIAPKNPTPTSSMVRYQTSTTLASIAAQTASTSDTQHTACDGDSGGAMLMTLGGVETLIGVISRGSPGCAGDTDAARVDTHLAFLLPYIEANDPGFLDRPDASVEPDASEPPAELDSGSPPAEIDASLAAEPDAGSPAAQDSGCSTSRGGSLSGGLLLGALASLVALGFRRHAGAHLS
jgi:secreted trypsin-like serine protease